MTDTIFLIHGMCEFSLKLGVERMWGRETSALHYVFERKGPQLQSKTITQAPKKDIGVTVVVRHDTVPEQSDITIPNRPKTQRGRYNVRDVPSGSWPVLIDRGIKAESCTD